MRETAFKLYLIFTVSWFLHLSARIPILGIIRIDLLLVVVITLMVFTGKNSDIKPITSNRCSRILFILIAYSVITVPFVEWPGSVINNGLPSFVRAVVFYFFSVFLINSERKLKIFLAVFLTCQTIRIIEPLYLHLTQGYWGAAAYMSGEMMDRLSGAPYDIINPNGLAFVIDSVLPFNYFLSLVSIRWAIISILTFPAFIYTLVLTGSRSGFIGMLAIMVGIWYKSRKKIRILLIFMAVFIIMINFLNANLKDRYLSIFDSHTKNAATAEGRLTGMEENFKVAMRRPLFGYGLGTSREANANFGTEDKPAHNLYAELAQELGLIGLVIYLHFIKSIIQNFIVSRKTILNSRSDNKFLTYVEKAMEVWLLMNILFSFASYGLSSYEWYLFAGFSVILATLKVSEKQSLVVKKDQSISA